MLWVGPQLTSSAHQRSYSQSVHLSYHLIYFLLLSFQMIDIPQFHPISSVILVLRMSHFSGTAPHAAGPEYQMVYTYLPLCRAEKLC